MRFVIFATIILVTTLACLFQPLIYENKVNLSPEILAKEIIVDGKLEPLFVKKGTYDKEYDTLQKNILAKVDIPEDLYLNINAKLYEDINQNAITEIRTLKDLKIFLDESKERDRIKICVFYIFFGVILLLSLFFEAITD